MTTFSDEILDRYKKPTHTKKPDNITHTYTVENPLCGDQVTLHLNVADGVITEASHEGKSCVVAFCGAELMIDEILGKPVEILNADYKFPEMDIIAKSLTPSRLKCLFLSIHALFATLNSSK